MADNLHKGWRMINDQQRGLEGGKYANIHNNSGVWTIGDEGLCSGVPEKCEPYIDRKIGAELIDSVKEYSNNDFDTFKDDFGEITKIRYNTSCNEEMLVMWFNNDGRSGYNNEEYECILDDNHIFDIKNVDECEHLIYCQSGNSNTFRATSAYTGSLGSQKFPKSTYIDSGYPYISVSPCIGDYTQKYSANTQYNGHKIKYRPTDEKIPDSFYKKSDSVGGEGHLELVELYFPHLYDENNDVGKNTKVIGLGAFSGCSRLSAVTFSRVEIISGSAFYNCGLKSIDWGHHVSNGGCCESNMKKIGADAFHNNKDLTCINLPNGLQVIEPGAFYGCGSAQTECLIYIPSSVTGMGCSAFVGIPSSKIRWDISDEDVDRLNIMGCSPSSTIVFSGSSVLNVLLPNITCDTVSTIKALFANSGDDSKVRFYINDNTCIGGNVHSLSEWEWSPEFPFNPIS